VTSADDVPQLLKTTLPKPGMAMRYLDTALQPSGIVMQQSAMAMQPLATMLPPLVGRMQRPPMTMDILIAKKW